MGSIFNLIPVLILWFIISFILYTRKHLKTKKVLAQRRYEGFGIAVNMPEATLPVGKTIYGFAPTPGRGQPLLAAQIMLGRVECQSGSTVTISLLGRFERVDGSTIREVITDGFPQRIYRIGETIPMALDFNVPMRQSTTHNATIELLYAPGDE